MTEQQNSPLDHQDEVTLQLHKEEIEINKKWVDTADVTIYKKKYTEEKQILVPVTREDLIIEKKVANPENPADTKMETIRIPLSEDQIEVSLTPTILNDVEICKNQYEELIKVHETLKEEKVHIETVGNVKLADDDPLTSD
ncbi:YsnF/AvaK domain-containing protein [Neobacillus cucumis]|uniref:YsnF/AvaK domain-containing protein n=1 Tax=Neobacillus cucumis TaxID=1740721 RepID=UPI002041CF22|nr:YsnF/AvaK domain-containing protein [Neobacillus cucumis]MCM3727788.1 YsnF/AvaK domain-containing protein [Neobacillus cucumis]